MVSREIHINGVEYKNIGDKLFVTLSDNSNLNIIDLGHFINKYNSKDIIIYNFTNVKSILDTFKVIKSIKVDGKIKIDMHTFINKNSNNVMNLIMGFNNRTYIDLNNIPENVELCVFNKNHTQNEFTTWAHNLNDENKHKLIRLLNEDEKELFKEEERVILSFFKKITSIYPNILEMPKKEAFNTIFEYFIKAFPYANEATKNGKQIKDNCQWAQNAVETYNRGRGVCEGRANLLTLVTNNCLLRLNCTVVDGHFNTIPHSWNEFIDENKEVYDYDLSTAIKECNSIKQMKEEYKYYYYRVYPIVIESKMSRIGDKRPISPSINKGFRLINLPGLN